MGNGGTCENESKIEAVRPNKLVRSESDLPVLMRVIHPEAKRERTDTESTRVGLEEIFVAYMRRDEATPTVESEITGARR